MKDRHAILVYVFILAAIAFTAAIDSPLPEQNYPALEYLAAPLEHAQWPR